LAGKIFLAGKKKARAITKFIVDGGIKGKILRHSSQLIACRFFYWPEMDCDE
jgi:hypothetical protein